MMSVEGLADIKSDATDARETVFMGNRDCINQAAIALFRETGT
jgi:hypothetical protein